MKSVPPLLAPLASGWPVTPSGPPGALAEAERRLTRPGGPGRRGHGDRRHDRRARRGCGRGARRRPMPRRRPPRPTAAGRACGGQRGRGCRWLPPTRRSAACAPSSKASRRGARPSMQQLGDRPGRERAAFRARPWWPPLQRWPGGRARVCAWPSKRPWARSSTGLVLDPDDARALAEAAAVMVLRDGGDGRSRGGDRAAPEAARMRVERGRWWRARRQPSASIRTPTPPACWLACRGCPPSTTPSTCASCCRPGWRLVTRDGVVVDDVGVIRPAPGVSTLERRAVRDEVARRAERVQRGARDGEPARRRGGGGRAPAPRPRCAARARPSTPPDAGVAWPTRPTAATASAAENAARELAWQEALLERARTEAATATEEARQRAAELERLRLPARRGRAPATRRAAALEALEARVAALRSERDVAAERGRRGASGPRSSHGGPPPCGGGAGPGRGPRRGARSATRSRSAAATPTWSPSASAWPASWPRPRRDRSARARPSRPRWHQPGTSAMTCCAAETDASAARERLRVAENRSRQSEVAEMEARMQVDAAREGLLVELASIGDDGLQTLLAQAEQAALAEPAGADELPELLETALDAALDAWRASATADTELPEPPTRVPHRGPAPAFQRRRCQQPLRGAGAGRGQGAAGVARGPARGPREGHPRHARDDRPPRQPHDRAVPPDVRGARGCLRPALPPALRWRRGACSR